MKKKRFMLFLFILGILYLAAMTSCVSTKKYQRDVKAAKNAGYIEGMIETFTFVDSCLRSKYDLSNDLQ